MDFGIFAKTFVRPSLGQVLDAVVERGLRHIQFNLSSVGLPTLPAELPDIQYAAIREEFERRGLAMTAISGTFNIIHPDRRARAQGLEKLRVLAGASKALGTDLITVSTGTCNPEDLWRGHPENNSAAAWREMLDSMEQIAQVGEERGVRFAFEPEQANVVNSARKARELLDALRSRYVGVLIDPANLLDPGNILISRDVVAEAFDLVGGEIMLAHAKDISATGLLGNLALGKGVLDFAHYFRLLKSVEYSLPVIAHGFSEAEVPESFAYLRSIGAAVTVQQIAEEGYLSG
jgi:sugar phosphate isomerase/epimerase